jgi:hypothetical protein
MTTIPWYLGNSRGFNFWPVGIIILALWSAVWTGLALWNAARRGDKGWFVLFLIVHTCGIIELMYLLLVAKIQDNPVKASSRRRKK